MLDLSGAPASKIFDAAVGGETRRAPNAGWGLNAELVLERAQLGASAERPVAPGGASQSVLRNLR